MGVEGSTVDPPFDEHKPVGIVDVHVYIVGDAPGFCAGPRHVLSAERQSIVHCVGANSEIADDKNHAGHDRRRGRDLTPGRRTWGFVYSAFTQRCLGQ